LSWREIFKQGGAEAGQEVVVPLAMVKYLGMTSLITLQNPDAGQVATMPELTRGLWRTDPPAVRPSRPGAVNAQP